VVALPFTSVENKERNKISENIFFDSFLLMIRMYYVTSERNYWPAILTNYQKFLHSIFGSSVVDVVIGPRARQPSNLGSIPFKTKDFPRPEPPDNL
jgi:hypothetical protein